MKETRKRIADIEAKKGNMTHPYVKEFYPPAKEEEKAEPKPKPKEKKKWTKYRK